MTIKFFCDRCDKEMWQGLATRAEKIRAISEDCICSDCIMLDATERWYRKACEADQLREVYGEDGE